MDVLNVEQKRFGILTAIWKYFKASKPAMFRFHRNAGFFHPPAADSKGVLTGIES
jgi:hypothetical protein